MTAKKSDKNTFKWDSGVHAKLLRDARLREGMTRGQLAEKLGISSMTVFNWENGKNTPQRNKLPRLMKLFGEKAFNPETTPDEEGPTSLATWVLRKRTENKWTRLELAQRAKVTEQTIWNIETGKTKNPQRMTIESIESVFDELLPDDIVSEIDENSVVSGCYSNKINWLVSLPAVSSILVVLSA